MVAFPAEKVAQHAAWSAVAVTKSDATVLGMTRSLYVGGAGDVAVRMKSGVNATFVGVVAGSILPVQCDQVLSTGTSATSILALY